MTSLEIMDMNFLFAVLLLLDLTVHYSENAKFTIIPSPDSPCPGEFTGRESHASLYSSMSLIPA